MAPTPMPLLSYDPRDIIIIVAGIILPGGYAEDSMIKVTFDNPFFDDVVGVDGQPTRVLSHDRRALVTINLMQSSKTNDILSNLLIRDINTPGGAGVGAFLMKDLNGFTKAQSPACWVKGPPEQEFGKKPGPRAWELRLSYCEPFVGGARSVL